MIDKSVNFITWSDFKNTQMYDCLTKAYFSFENEKDEKKWGVSDINQYNIEGGSYFCTTNNCVSHYRDNPGYDREYDFELDNNTIIAISYNEYLMQDEKLKEIILQSSDGFYCPKCDTYGLVVWNRNKISFA
jgi:hypothetical protein